MNRKVALFAVPLLGAGASLFATVPESQAWNGSFNVTAMDSYAPGQHVTWQSLSVEGEDGSTIGKIPTSDNELEFTNLSTQAADVTVCWGKIADPAQCQHYKVAANSNVTATIPQKYGFKYAPLGSHYTAIY